MQSSTKAPRKAFHFLGCTAAALLRETYGLWLVRSQPQLSHINDSICLNQTERKQWWRVVVVVGGAVNSHSVELPKHWCASNTVWTLRSCLGGSILVPAQQAFKNNRGKCTAVSFFSLCAENICMLLHGSNKTNKQVSQVFFFACATNMNNSQIIVHNNCLQS